MGDEVSALLDKRTVRMNADGHEDEAEALRLIDLLMREYAYTRDPLTSDAIAFAGNLRDLVEEWKRSGL